MSAKKLEKATTNSRKELSASQRQSTTSENINQKKKTKNENSNRSSESENKTNNNGENKAHLTLFSDKIFKHDKDNYMKTFIKADKENKFQAKCEICDGEVFLAQYANQHIQIKKHREKTEKLQGKRGINKLEKLILAITTNKKQVNNKISKEEKEIEETKKYLEFVAFALSQKFSFLQVSTLGRFLKDMLNRKDGIGLDFFRWHSFDRDMLSKIAVNCFKPHLIDELKESLQNKRFSFSIDANTVAGENLCAMKVRFLDKEFEAQEKE